MAAVPPDGPITGARLIADLERLGLSRGDIVLVHASMRRLGFVVGGAVVVVHSLLDVIGAEGTVIAPTMTADNSDPGRWAATRKEAVPETWWPVIRESMPGFDRERTPSLGMGAIAETIRTWPGAVRSAHPQTSFAALGRDAAELMADHDLECHLGQRSPLGRLYATGQAKVLLLGVGYDVCTTFHLAEYRVPGRDTRDYECVIAEDGRRRWYRYRDVVLDDSDFGRLGPAFERSDKEGLVLRGWVGRAASRLFPLRPAVEFATDWITAHRSAPTFAPTMKSSE